MTINTQKEVKMDIININVETKLTFECEFLLYWYIVLHFPSSTIVVPFESILST